MWRHNKHENNWFFWLITGNWIWCELKIVSDCVKSCLTIHICHLNQTRPVTCEYHVYTQSNTDWFQVCWFRCEYICWRWKFDISLIIFCAIWHGIKINLMQEFQQQPSKSCCFQDRIQNLRECFRKIPVVSCVIFKYILNWTSFLCADRLWL